MDWVEIAGKVNGLSGGQARLVLLLIINTIASEQELDQEKLEGFLKIAETWPEKEA